MRDAAAKAEKMGAGEGGNAFGSSGSAESSPLPPTHRKLGKIITPLPGESIQFARAKQSESLLL